MSRALKITFIVSLVAVFAIAILREALAQSAPTPAETVCMQRSAGDLVAIMRLQNAVAELQAQIDKRKAEDEAAAKVKP